MASEGEKPKKASDGTVEVFDPLKKYLVEIRRFPLLTRPEEMELAKRWLEEKDRYAAYRLVVSNLRLVVKIAFEYQRAYSNILDLIQEGNLGLMQAVKKFDPYRDVKLSSYASWWIRAYILKFLIDNWSLVKIGTTQAQRKLFLRLKKEKGRLEAMGFDPGPKLLAGRLN
ncbi:MAG TPA: sigma-70 family RNA polymerase sigma factor, partial [Thermodesulfobacteriota bacterium]|nr:sigma-70 family RNA polymerase sigma factor [Thermodesulfobacteriota bacterium]